MHVDRLAFVRSLRRNAEQRVHPKEQSRHTDCINVFPLLSAGLSMRLQIGYTIHGFAVWPEPLSLGLEEVKVKVR